MFIKLSSLNLRGFREQSKADRLLRDLGSFDVEVDTFQETHFLATSMFVYGLTTLLFIQRTGTGRSEVFPC